MLKNRVIISSNLEYDDLFTEIVPKCWDILLINGDDRSNVLQCLSLPGIYDLAIYWPVVSDDSLPDIRKMFRLASAARQVRNVTAKHFPAGLYGSRITHDGFTAPDYAGGAMMGCDVLHGPVCFRPSLAASVLSHGQGIECRRFTESLCISVALAYRRCGYALMRDLQTWDRPDIASLKSRGWSSKVRAVS